MFKLGRFLDGLSRVLALVAGAVVMLMMLHVFVDVAGRYLFSAPLPNTLEIVSEYYMVVVVFLPLALTERNRAHISVEVLTRHLPCRIQTWLSVLAWLVSTAFFAALAYRTWLDAVERTEAGTTVLGAMGTLTTWPSYYFMPLGCAAVALVLLYRAIATLTNTPSGLADPEPPESISE